MAANDLRLGDPMQDAPNRVHDLKCDIADRLRPVCPSFTEDELQRLAERMAAVQLKYERRVVLDFSHATFFGSAITTTRDDVSFER